MSNNTDIVGIISLIIGVVSLGLAVYQTPNQSLQIGYLITLVLSGVVFFLYSGQSKLILLLKENQKTREEISKINERMNLYDRLGKIEAIMQVKK